MEISSIQIGIATVSFCVINFIVCIYLVVQLNAVKERQMQHQIDADAQLKEVSGNLSSLIANFGSSLQKVISEDNRDVLKVLAEQNQALKQSDTALVGTIKQLHQEGAERHRLGEQRLLESIANSQDRVLQAQTLSAQELMLKVQQGAQQIGAEMTDAKEELIKRMRSDSDANKQWLQGLAESVNQHQQQSEQALNELAQAGERIQRQSEFGRKQGERSMIEQLSGVIQALKIENAIELTNGLASGKELKVETADFIKHLGDCKVTRMEDKASNQVTEIIYNEGKKVASQTFADGLLKYQMTFDSDGKLTKGEEFDDQGNMVFEYQYNAAGEITNRIDF
ncbi:hypothetical protein SAMN04488540_10982 [Ferrimonas sediminum]|uniref:Uncharacterized protein n=1 Tax=Ferrimonas sediminum TaxID=718193 RepID=A0A1G8UGI1_9GAMM|nr:hypothetical protein [Ferrimonas sediminum]SDJ52838.1 hypothetical protein SAMN04488540_10982 [Ferrimonas sediminum]